MENQELAVNEQPTELVNVAKESGIELSKAEAITAGYIPFLANIQDAEQESKKINFESPTKIDELIAREIRLKLVPNRTAADKFKKECKEATTLINGLHDGAYKVIENTSKLLELKLANVEKVAEIKEKARIEALRLERSEEIKKYGESYAVMDLGNMSDEVYQDIFNGAKLNFEYAEKVKAEQEAARVLAEQKAIELQRRKDALVIAGFSFDGNNYFVSDFKKLDSGTIIALSEPEFNEVLEAGVYEIGKLKCLERDKLEAMRIANEEKEKQLEAERLKKEAQDKIRNKRNEELKPYIVFIRDYNALLNASDSEYEKQLKEIQQAAIDQAAYDAKAQQVKFEKELKEQQELAEQKAKADKLAAELKAKEDLEAKQLADQLAAEKKAAKAPDKEKIKQIAMQLEVVMSSLPAVKTEEATVIINQIKELIQKTITFTKTKSDLL